MILRRLDVAPRTPWVLKRAPAATIVSMGTNNDGHTEQGITFPSGPAQRELGTAVRCCASADLVFPLHAPISGTTV